MEKTKVDEYFFRSEFEEEGFEIMKLSTFFQHRSSSARKEAHIIRFYAIIFITGGEGSHLIDFENYKCKKGTMLFIGKDQLHAWSNSKDLTGYIILFNESFLYDNQIKFKDLSFSYPYNSSIYKPVLHLENEEYYQAFQALVNYLFQEYNLPKLPTRMEILQCLLRAFLLKIQSHPLEELNKYPADAKEIFIKFQRLLNEKIALTRNANDYCDFLSVTYRKLNNACRTLTNKTVKQFIDDFLILKAKRSLLDSGNNVNETAYSLGFDEVTNFTKYFKKHTGISPKAFSKIEK
ncbi:MAG: helix-turn-helix domain-containing protein [Crocinitomix sp.]|nr:helix-turn-helix domain-containing protein [Crocinitomix sp.]